MTDDHRVTDDHGVTRGRPVTPGCVVTDDHRVTDDHGVTGGPVDVETRPSFCSAEAMKTLDEILDAAG